MSLVWIACGAMALAAALVALGAITQIAALSMPGVGLMTLAAVPLVAGVWRLILPVGQEHADDPDDSLVR
ncbi:MAG TPA: hypothetical protein VFX49_21450 [Chloroflexota bacterium]|nr:hypothetical protein [Chloroflexota bacterium]